MSDRAPPGIYYYIAYPPEDVIACEICHNNDDEVREDARRQRGVFKAATRRQNYALHLARQHEVSAENVKIRCSLCGRVSDKPSRTAWRDTQSHHRRQHAARSKVQPVDAVGNKVVELPLVPDKAESTVALQGREKKKVAAIGRRKKTVGTGTITATIKQEPKDLLPNKSMIISGMGKMFDVVVDNDPSQVPIHSTPSRGLKSAKASSAQKKGVEVSRIVSKARPPVKRSLFGQFEPPQKRFQPALSRD